MKFTAHEPSPDGLRSMQRGADRQTCKLHIRSLLALPGGSCILSMLSFFCVIHFMLHEPTVNCAMAAALTARRVRYGVGADLTSSASPVLRQV
jgi:hypothetical protein